jgi:hypothetical protein
MQNHVSPLFTYHPYTNCMCSSLQRQLLPGVRSQALEPQATSRWCMHWPPLVGSGRTLFQSPLVIIILAEIIRKMLGQSHPPCSLLGCSPISTSLLRKRKISRSPKVYIDPRARILVLLLRCLQCDPPSVRKHFGPASMPRPVSNSGKTRALCSCQLRHGYAASTGTWPVVDPGNSTEYVENYYRRVEFGL